MQRESYTPHTARKNEVRTVGRTEPESFEAFVRRWRRAAGMSQEELADRAGLSVRAIGNLERGAKTRPHRDTILLISEALGLGAEEPQRPRAGSANDAGTRH